jgi:hypothetical protein
MSYRGLVAAPDRFMQPDLAPIPLRIIKLFFDDPLGEKGFSLIPRVSCLAHVGIN